VAELNPAPRADAELGRAYRLRNEPADLIERALDAVRIARLLTAPLATDSSTARPDTG